MWQLLVMAAIAAPIIHGPTTVQRGHRKVVGQREGSQGHIHFDKGSHIGGTAGLASWPLNNSYNITAAVPAPDVYWTGTDATAGGFSNASFAVVGTLGAVNQQTPFTADGDLSGRSGDLKAFYFNGTGSIEAPLGGPLASLCLENCSIFIVYNHTDLNKSKQILWIGPNGGARPYIAMQTDGGGNYFDVFVQDSAGSISPPSVSFSGITDPRLAWNYAGVTMAYNSADKKATVALYRNGRLVAGPTASAAGTGNRASYTDPVITIGARSDAAVPISANVALVLVWNSVLTSDQMADLYQALVNYRPEGAVGWRLTQHYSTNAQISCMNYDKMTTQYGPALHSICTPGMITECPEGGTCTSYSRPHPHLLLGAASESGFGNQIYNSADLLEATWTLSDAAASDTAQTDATQMFDTRTIVTKLVDSNGAAAGYARLTDQLDKNMNTGDRGVLQIIAMKPSGVSAAQQFDVRLVEVNAAGEVSATHDFPPATLESYPKLFAFPFTWVTATATADQIQLYITPTANIDGAGTGGSMTLVTGLYLKADSEKGYVWWQISTGANAEFGRIDVSFPANSTTFPGILNGSGNMVRRNSFSMRSIFSPYGRSMYLTSAGTQSLFTLTNNDCTPATDQMSLRGYYTGVGTEKLDKIISGTATTLQTFTDANPIVTTPGQAKGAHIQFKPTGTLPTGFTTAVIGGGACATTPGDFSLHSLEIHVP